MLFLKSNAQLKANIIYYCVISMLPTLANYFFSIYFINRDSHQRFSIKRGVLQACNFIQKRLKHRCFPLNFAKFLRTLILKNICEQLLFYQNSDWFVSPEFSLIYKDLLSKMFKIGKKNFKFFKINKFSVLV